MPDYRPYFLAYDSNKPTYFIFFGLTYLFVHNIIRLKYDMLCQNFKTHLWCLLIFPRVLYFNRIYESLCFSKMTQYLHISFLHKIDK